jgi:hypothetical protein
VYVKNCKLLKTKPVDVGVLEKIKEVYKIKDNIRLAKTNTAYKTILAKVKKDLVKDQLRRHSARILKFINFGIKRELNNKDPEQNQSGYDGRANQSENLTIAEMKSAVTRTRLPDNSPKCDYCDKLGYLVQACRTKIVDQKKRAREFGGRRAGKCGSNGGRDLGGRKNQKTKREDYDGNSYYQRGGVKHGKNDDIGGMGKSGYSKCSSSFTCHSALVANSRNLFFK